MFTNEQSVGRGAADRVVRDVIVDWRRPGQLNRSAGSVLLNPGDPHVH